MTNRENLEEKMRKLGELAVSLLEKKTGEKLAHLPPDQLKKRMKELKKKFKNEKT